MLAGPQYRHSGTIRLKVVPGGFATVKEPDLRVTGTELVCGDREVPLNGATCRELATAVNAEAGAAEDLYRDGSGVDPDETLGVDAEATRRIHEAFGRGHEACRDSHPRSRRCCGRSTSTWASVSTRSTTACPR